MAMRTMGTYHAGRILVAVGDITGFKGDAIVNAANSALAGGGGVDGAIHNAAGSALVEACRALRIDTWPDGLPTGRAVATGAGNLAVKGVIHAVGPIWRGGQADEVMLLASAYQESLAIAYSHNWISVAFPAISTGVYGYPKAEAANIAFKTVSSYLDEHAVPATVWFVFFTKADAETFMAAIDGTTST
jgi:O-acetyl-ADP-ribose deacetylase (regulator of RNase III)